MRADEGKRQRVDKLERCPFFPAVVAANQAYLQAAVTDPEVSECSQWVLTCLPTSVPGRLSAISMKGMETFVLHLPEQEDRLLDGFVNLRRSFLDHPSRSQRALATKFPSLEMWEDRKYRDAGPDQCQISGHYDDLIAALAEPDIAAATRDLAESLLATTTEYSRYHNYQLADHVLGRA